MALPFLSAAHGLFFFFYMHVCIVSYYGCWPLDKQQYSLHNWNINHMEKENEVENKPLKLFSWPAGFLLFTNFLHSTRNIFSFFFSLFSLVPCFGLFYSLDNIWCCLMIQNSLWLLLFLWLVVVLKIENLLFCSASLLIQSFFLSFFQPSEGFLSDCSIKTKYNDKSITKKVMDQLSDYYVNRCGFFFFWLFTTEILIKYWKMLEWIVKMVI